MKREHCRQREQEMRKHEVWIPGCFQWNPSNQSCWTVGGDWRGQAVKIGQGGVDHSARGQAGGLGFVLWKRCPGLGACLALCWMNERINDLIHIHELFNFFKRAFHFTFIENAGKRQEWNEMSCNSCTYYLASFPPILKDFEHRPGRLQKWLTRITAAAVRWVIGRKSSKLSIAMVQINNGGKHGGRCFLGPHVRFSLSQPLK